MKRIFIVHSNMEIGGAETSLLGLLNSIDYSKFSVDLLLLDTSGDLLKMIPKQVNLLKDYTCYKNLVKPIKDVIKDGSIGIALARFIGKVNALYSSKKIKSNNIAYMIKQYSHRYSMPFLPKINDTYDLSISFIDPHYIISNKVSSKIKLGWLHTDFSRVKVNEIIDYKMWDGCDYIVCVSEACKIVFDEKYPGLKHKSIVIENILPVDFIKQSANLYSVKDTILKSQDYINICSVGRFSEAKNFDNIPSICKIIQQLGFRIKWYIIGYGNEEEKIRRKIKEEKMEDSVIILGKKQNPYPYIKACDMYIQPSRFEGKAVTVREAQVLNKPVVITNFKTASSQLVDNIDGVIVPMDNYGCAKGIVSIIQNPELQKKLIKNTMMRDYSNQNEIKKIYELIN